VENYITGTPGFQTAQVATPRSVFLNPNFTQLLPRGKQIDGLNAADPDNSPDTNVLRAGLLMGKITPSGLYGSSIIGVTQGALTSVGTTITLTPAQAVELVRRVGATGTLTLTGPPAASGVVRSLTATYSGVVVTTGVVTMTALGANEVQVLNFANSPSGTFTLGIVDKNGVSQTTGLITYSGTIATLLTNLQAATDLVLATNAIVWTGSVVTAVSGTFSGTGYAGLPQPLITTDGLGTAGSLTITRATPGVNGAFVAGSLVGPTDGSQVPNTLINSDNDPYGILVTSNDNITRITVPFPNLPVTGLIITGNVINWPTDPSLRTWVRTNLSTLSGGKWLFDDVW
jgi:hypothetical protein